jgi:hypothetical protein
VYVTEVAEDLSFQGVKTLVLHEACKGCCEPYHIHTQAEILVG